MLEVLEMSKEGGVTLTELRALVGNYGNALTNEADTVREAARTKSAVLDEAYKAGAINGRNAEQRAVQTSEVLSNNEVLQRIQAQAEACTAYRKSLEAEIGLIKAWLYSQARIG